MKKVVLKVDIYSEKVKTKAMKAVSGISGVESLSVDMKEKKLTVTGDMDPVEVVKKLRKLCLSELISVGPTKEEKNKYPNDISDLVKAYEAYYSGMRPQYYHVTSVEENPNACVVC